MCLKRKRSESELAVFSSTQSLSSSRFSFDAMSAMDTARRGFFVPRLPTPSHLPIRTMKRFRDNRPSESEVYQHTLDVLYSAQRRDHEPHCVQPPRSPRITGTQAPTEAHTQIRRRGQQRSLHSFWNLPVPATSTDSLTSSPASSAMAPPSPTLTPPGTPTNCEDCGTGLGTGDNDVVMMDIDGYGLGVEDHTCVACGKTVCFSCSVSNLGEHRQCLVCVGPKGRVGGNSWMARHL
ncbi:uncharacterized protein B0T15DRAFT_434322 [Chaetomium strumarium]|uniref:Uncharacterized protein n=1 Tax=Chaetomium strumarium TaxID=1170767 RepID=A0AAJ0M1F1_9PEZI|nr:hypothetical protein B0T15DRAFT_434322 [Chaetomium strumarium]